MPSERRPLSQKVIDELYEEATLDLKYSNPQSPCQGNQADCASAVLGLIATVADLRRENETLQRALLDIAGPCHTITCSDRRMCDECIATAALAATQGGDDNAALTQENA